ncbi:MAG: response regulator [Lentisphaeraceae bacterium]|nr:response regulator [Lentisphaeraceae bacterium]
MEKKFLLPGEFHVTKKPMNLVTVLGSCVSVCLYNKISGLAGMNHFVFPEGENIDKVSRGRYGNTANNLIAQSLFAVDAERSHYVAKVYGGANPLQSDTGTDTQIGVRNVKAAEEFLQQVGIPIKEKIVGSKKGYRIYFNTESGDVKVEEIARAGEAEAKLKKDISAGKVKNKRVLVVDDSALVRKVLTSTIDSIVGYEVCGQAANAFEARDMLVNLKPDVMTLDIIMPKLDGISFLKKVTQHFPMPVIICSTIAKEGTAIQKEAYDSGAVEVIDKDTLELYKGVDTVQKTISAKLDSALKKFKVRT